MAQNSGVAETFDVFGNKVSGTSVKVHHQPGGASSFQIGGNYYGEDDKPKTNAAAATVPVVAADATEENKDEENKDAEAQAVPAEAEAAGSGAAGSGAATGAVRGTNALPVSDAFGNKVNGTSIRVRAPPGGASSITF